MIAADIDAQATEEEIATALENADPSDVIVASSGVVDSATWVHQRQPSANCGVSLTQFRIKIHTADNIIQLLWWLSVHFL